MSVLISTANLGGYFTVASREVAKKGIAADINLLPAKVLIRRANHIRTGMKMEAKKKISHLFTLNNIFLFFCFLLFLVFLINTFQMEDASSFMLPRMLCIFGLAVIALMIVLTVFRAETIDTSLKETPEQKDGLSIGYSIILVVVYFFMTNIFGFILVTCLSIISFSYIMKYRNKKIVILLSVVIPLMLHLAFVTLLKAPLPQGLVENLLFILTK